MVYLAPYLLDHSPLLTYGLLAAPSRELFLLAWLLGACFVRISYGVSVVFFQHPISLQFGPRQCPSCGSPLVHFSRRNGFSDFFLYPLMLLRPFRCGECGVRHYSFYFRVVDSVAAAQRTNRVLEVDFPKIVSERTLRSKPTTTPNGTSSVPKKIWIGKSGTFHN